MNVLELKQAGYEYVRLTVKYELMLVATLQLFGST